MKQVLNQKDKSEIRQTKTTLAKKLGVSRGMLYYKHKMPTNDESLKEQIEKVLRDKPKLRAQKDSS